MRATRRYGALILSIALLMLTACSGTPGPGARGSGGNLPQPPSPAPATTPGTGTPGPASPGAAGTPTAQASPPATAPATPSSPTATATANPAAAPANPAPAHSMDPGNAAAAPATPTAPTGAAPASPAGPAQPSPAAPTPAPPQPKPAGPPREVSIILDWYPNAVHTFLYAAAEQGYFAQEGLHVTFKMPGNDPTDGLKLVAAGKETFCLYYQPDILVARAQEIPVVSVAPVVRHPLDVLMAPKSLGLKSPKDLMGKVVGYPTIPTDINYVSVMVSAAGGDASKVRFADVGWDLIASMATRQVDAIIGGYINHEKLVLEKQGMPMTVFKLQDFGVPDYYELMLVTSEKTAAADRPMVEAFWRAASKGLAWVKAHPEAAIDLLMKVASPDFPLERDVEVQSLQILFPLMDDGGRATFGAQERGSYSTLAVWLGLEGVLAKPVDADKAFISVVP